MNPQSTDIPSQTLTGKVAVVTGAGRGIGRAIALGYANAGARVACAARTQEEIESVVHEIESAGGEAIAVVTDVTVPGQIAHLLQETASRFGGLDILVINAGVELGKGPVEKSDPSGWEETLAVNLTGAYHCARLAIPHLKRRGGGKIITIGSGLGQRGRPGLSAYAVSKAGLSMLTRVLAQELWADKISVNELIPGPVNTAMVQGDDGERETSITDESEWWKEPEDVVPLALFLAAQPDTGPTAQRFSLMRRD